MEKNSQHNQKRKCRWPWWSLVVLVVLIGGFRLSLMSGLVHNFVKNQIITAANDELTVTLDIRHLEGDLWQEAKLYDISIHEDDDNAASVDSLVIRYDVLSYFTEVFEVPEIIIAKPELDLKKEEDRWNVSRWMPPAADDTTESEAFPFHIANFSILDGAVNVDGNLLPADSSFALQNIQFDGEFGIRPTGDVQAGVTNFSFSAVDTPLREALTVESQAMVEDSTVNLQQLVVATGQSMVESSGSFQPSDSSGQFSLNARPISWQDIQAVAQDVPIREDIDLTLGFAGNFSEGTLSLAINSENLRGVESQATFQQLSDPRLSEFTLQADELDLASFWSDSTLPVIKQPQFSANGDLLFSEPSAGQIEGNLSTGSVAFLSHQLDELSARFGLEDQHLSFESRGHTGKQEMQFLAEVEHLFDEQPRFRVDAEGEHIDPAYWAGDENISGDLSFSAKLEGQGLTPEDQPWSYNFNVEEGMVAGQSFSSVSSSGDFTSNNLTNISNLQLDDTKIALTTDWKNLQSVPDFDYNIELQRGNLSEIVGFESFPTVLNGTLEGNGSGNALENLRLTSAIKLDSSSVNNEPLESLEAQLEVKDTVATISQASLNSGIADANFDAQIHLADWYHASNTLDFETQIKDLEPLTPLVGGDQLQATGSVRGALRPEQEQKLKFNGNVDLQDVAYDSLLTIDSAWGDVGVLVQEQPEYNLDITLQSLEYDRTKLEDFNLQTSGKVETAHTQGDLELNFANSEEGRIHQAGSYYVDEDSSAITTNELDFSSSLRTLSLQNPFTFSYANDVVRMDTLHLRSGDEAMLMLAVPYADSVNQQGYLKGEKLDLHVLQDILLSEPYVGGILSGEFSFRRADTSLLANGNLKMVDLSYNELGIDTLKLDSEIADDMLTANLNVIDEGDNIVEGSTRLPFKLGDPTDFDSTFFERPVQGHLRVGEIGLDRYEEVISDLGIENTGGRVTFDGSLEGKAGSPDFSGRFLLKEGTLSGVGIDSLTASLDYEHDEERLVLGAAVHSLQQKAADINSQIPFSVDFRTFEVTLPEERDRINADVVTNDFDLVALNDFVDRQQLRDITGRLNGEVAVTGRLENLQADGELTLTDAGMRVIPAGIRLQDMESTVGFEPGQINIKEFRTESDNGYLTLDGTVGFEELVPGDLDLSLSASNFRAANTADYNAIINSETRFGGTASSPEVSGEINFQNGFLRLNNFGEKSVENVELDDEESEQGNTALYDSLKLDMDVNFDERFFIRNTQYLEMEIELDGQVDLVKEVQRDLEMFGSLNAASGYALPLGKRFDIEEGAITFSGDPANPEVNVRSLYEPRQPEEDIKIWYVIEGTVEDPQFSYESTPEMELENIVSYTLFGKPFYELDSWQQVVTGSGGNTSATDVAVDVLMDRVESLATRRLGIDVVRIDNTRSGGENGTSITTGWYVNPRVFFAIQNIITGTSPDTGFLLEYMLNDNLKLIMSQGNDSRQGVDLKWNYDY